jgi:hypothetical protein
MTEKRESPLWINPGSGVVHNKQACKRAKGTKLESWLGGEGRACSACLPAGLPGQGLL